MQCIGGSVGIWVLTFITSAPAPADSIRVTEYCCQVLQQHRKASGTAHSLVVAAYCKFMYLPIKACVLLISFLRVLGSKRPAYKATQSEVQ